MGLIYIHTTIYKVDNQLLYNTGNYPQYFVITYKPSTDGSAVKYPFVMHETQEKWVQSLDMEDLLEKEMETHSSILAWEIPQRRLVGPSPWDHKESDMTEQLSTPKDEESEKQKKGNRDFIFLGSKITADGDYSREIKRCLLLGRKAMTNLDMLQSMGSQSQTRLSY